MSAYLPWNAKNVILQYAPAIPLPVAIVLRDSMDGIGTGERVAHSIKTGKFHSAHIALEMKRPVHRTRYDM